MKALTDEVLGEFEDVAREGARQIKAFFAYQGDNQLYFKKARIGATVIAAYARARASETNRMALELAGERLQLAQGNKPQLLDDGRAA